MADIEKVTKGLECHKNGLCQIDDKTSCPYWECEKDCSKHLMADALELLKEQQPRLLTLVEVIKHYVVPDDIRDDLYKKVEYQYNIKPLYFDFPMSDNDAFILHWRGYEHVEKFLEDWKVDYGKTWRVWSDKPTEEQRKAEPWKDCEHE